MNVTQYPLYTASASQQIDAAAIAGDLETSFELMQRAADFCLRCIQARWPTANHVHLYCGNGHNGGDGFLLAAGLIRLGKTVTLEQVSDSALSDAVTERAWQVWQAADAQQEDRTPSPDTADLLVDAMLGTGLTRDVGGAYQRAVEQINASAIPVFAVDVPTGVDADHGRIWGCAVQADATATFITRKPGLYTAAGRGLSGDVAFHDLAVDATRFADILSIAKLQYGFRVPSRAADTHKNACGYVHIVGGNRDMPGALALAADMVMRSGAGKCTLQGHSANYSTVLARNPECMWWSGQSVPQSDVVLIGPGLGRDDWAKSQLDTLSGFIGQIVADADALFFVANNNDMPFGVDVVTPHIGEAARLLQVDSDVIVRTRLDAAQAIAQQFDSVCVLKGPGTVIAAPDGHVTIIDAGHPGMATAGSGDVLAGLIASFIAQGYYPEQAAIQASAMHAMAGEHAARRFGNGLIARNIVESAQCLMCC